MMKMVGFTRATYLRQEPDGSLCFMGRVDNVINFGGVKVAPERIEAMLSREMDITDCAVMLAETDSKTIVVFLDDTQYDIDQNALSDCIKKYFRIDFPVLIHRSKPCRVSKVVKLTEGVA